MDELRLPKPASGPVAPPGRGVLTNEPPVELTPELRTIRQHCMETACRSPTPTEDCILDFMGVMHLRCLGITVIHDGTRPRNTVIERPPRPTFTHKPGAPELKVPLGSERDIVYREFCKQLHPFLPHHGHEALSICIHVVRVVRRLTSAGYTIRFPEKWAPC